MYVYYENGLWEVELYVRDSLFEELKESNPEKKVTITREGEEKVVLIKDLEDYSVVRNTSYFGRL